MPTVIGVDFGNTNSCVTWVDERGTLHRVPVATGNPPYDTVLASIVLDPEDNSPLVGLEAREMYDTRRTGVYMRAFKPELDRQRLRERRWVRHGVKSAGHDWVHENERFVPDYRLEWTEGKYTRDQLVAGTARVVERLLDRAIAEGAGEGAEIWIGVPVSASTCTRKRLLCGLEATRRADGGRIFADFHDALKRVHFVLEPVAVVAAAGDDLEVEGEQNVLVFDHGGGTLDLSLVRFRASPPGRGPVPVRELAAGGSDRVAGTALDAAFLVELRRHPEIGEALDGMDEYLRDQAVEKCKLDLSRQMTAPLITDRGRFEVGRGTFERAAQPLLGGIADEVERTVIKRAGLALEDVHHVLMTGGSSLTPCVQALLGDLFAHLGDHQLLKYDASDTAVGGGVELAITDVSQGLSRFARQNTLEQVVLWDISVRAGTSARFHRAIGRGTPFKIEDGRPAVSLTMNIPKGSHDWSAIGAYEDELDRRYLFGVADVPPLPPGSSVALTLLRDAAFPRLEVYDGNGKLLLRDGIRLGWPDDDCFVRADLEEVAADRLADFMYEDAEFLPDSGFRYFETAPLARRLRLGDYIEWRRADGRTTRRRGTITDIVRRSDGASLEEMSSWDVTEFTFSVRDADRYGVLSLRTTNGAVRLAPRPDKGY